MAEYCDECGGETEHNVYISMIQESDESVFSREPYRVSECDICGKESKIRMNNA